jgi:hypothetical protein
MPGTKPMFVDSSDPLQMELSRWETEGGAVRGPPDDRFRKQASPQTRHCAGKLGHVARTSSILLEKWRFIFHRGPAESFEVIDDQPGRQSVVCLRR